MEGLDDVLFFGGSLKGFGEEGGDEAGVEVVGLGDGEEEDVVVFEFVVGDFGGDDFGGDFEGEVVGDGGGRGVWGGGEGGLDDGGEQEGIED